MPAWGQTARPFFAGRRAGSKLESQPPIPSTEDLPYAFSYMYLHTAIIYSIIYIYYARCCSIGSLLIKTIKHETLHRELVLLQLHRHVNLAQLVL